MKHINMLPVLQALSAVLELSVIVMAIYRMVQVKNSQDSQSDPNPAIPPLDTGTPASCPCQEDQAAPIQSDSQATATLPGNQDSSTLPPVESFSVEESIEATGKPTPIDYIQYLQSTGIKEGCLMEKSPRYRIVRVREFPDFTYRKSRLEEVLKAHIRDCGFTIQEFAREMHMDTATLNRWTKSIYSKNPTELVRSRRIEMAEQLISINPAHSADDVSVMCGFKSRKSFMSELRKERNCSFSQFVNGCNNL